MGGTKVISAGVVESALQTKQDNITDRIGAILNQTGYQFVTPYKVLEQSSRAQRTILITKTLTKDDIENTYVIAKIPIGHLVENKDRVLESWKITIYDENLFHSTSELQMLSTSLEKAFGTKVKYEFVQGGARKLESLSGIKRA